MQKKFGRTIGEGMGLGLSMIYGFAQQSGGQVRIYSEVGEGVPINLLVTDVGLPGGMNGRQMADAGRVKRPDLKVLFITGYAENAVLSNGHLAPGMAVLTKPFAIDAMTARIRSMIEAPRGEAAAS